MTLTLIDIRMVTDDVGTACVIQFRSERRPPDNCLVAIERPGQEKAFLSADGWQANYMRLNAAIRSDLPDLSNLRLPRNLLEFLEAGYNYRITLFDPAGVELGLFVVNWYLPQGFSLTVPSSRGVSVENRNVEDSVAVSRLPDPTDVEVDEGDVGAALVLPPPNLQLTPKVLASRKLMRCPGCGGEVFSTFSNCPYCGRDMR